MGGGGGGGRGFSAAARGGNPGAVNGGNNMSFRGASRMDRMHHGRDHDGRRFRGPGFAFGVGYPGYNYYAYDYDESCYQLRNVPTRHGWRWLRVWVCD
jgi:hypothetical protein